MKTCIHTFFTLFLAFSMTLPVITSCSDSKSGDDTVVDDSFSVSPATATADKDGGTVVLTVKSSRVPTVTSDASWITLGSRTIIDGGYALNMTVQPNTETIDRTATLTITCGGTKTVKVTQTAQDALKVETKEFNVDDQEQTITVKLTTNGVLNVNVDAGWLTATSMTETERSFHVDANYGAARTATITFTLGKLSEKVTVTQAQAILSATVDAGVVYQTIEGFAASDCWAPAVIGEYWTGSRDGIAELLFSREVADGKAKGIGLSMWRSNLGAGSAAQGLDSKIGVENGANGYNYYRRGDSYLLNDLTYDWSRCQGQRFFLDKARDYGVESVVLFSNSPNVQFTKNGKGYSDSGHSANLKGDCYDDFARYMAKVAAQYKAWGYPVTHISPVNEPQYTWDGHDQEGSGWTNAEIAKLTRELDASLTAEGLANVKIALAEAASWREAYQVHGSADYSDCIRNFFDPAHANYVGGLDHVAPIFGGHSYWTDGTWNAMRTVRQQACDRAKAYNVGLWQTEWSMLGDGYSEFPGYEQSDEMDIALVMDKVIYNDLTVANVSSWSFWTSMDVSRWSQLDRFMLIDFTPAGGTYSIQLEGEGTYKANPTLWVLGNYSLFVRPGYRRVEVDIPGMDRTFFGTGFLSPDGHQLVLVMSNLNEADMQFRLTLNGADAKSLTSYTTSRRKQLQQKTLDANNHELMLDGASVTTFVIEL